MGDFPVRYGALAFIIGLLAAAGQAFESASAKDAERSCPVTLPNGSAPLKNAGVNHGNGVLWVSLRANGKVVAHPGDVKPDGSIEAKFAWWRGVKGTLRITGRRLDAPAPPLRAHIPAGYGSRGFQATGIIFPTEGCWEVTGKVGRRARLTFVTLVVKAEESQ